MPLSVPSSTNSNPRYEINCDVSNISDGCLGYHSSIFPHSPDQNIGLPTNPPLRALVDVDEDNNEDGYDSDGVPGICRDLGASEEVPLVYFESEAGGSSKKSSKNSRRHSSKNTSRKDGSLTIDMVEKMNVCDIRDALGKRNLVTEGKK